MNKIIVFLIGIAVGVAIGYGPISFGVQTFYYDKGSKITYRMMRRMIKDDMINKLDKHQIEYLEKMDNKKYDEIK